MGIKTWNTRVYIEYDIQAEDEEEAMTRMRDSIQHEICDLDLELNEIGEFACSETDKVIDGE